MINLFSEINLRSHQIKNRVVMPPMVCFGFPVENGRVTEEHILHYVARAKGGVGLIIVEATCVNPTGRLSEKQLGLWSDEQIGGFSKIATGCHKYGAVVLVQIHHAGMGVFPGITDDVVSSSNFTGKSRFGGGQILARALTIDEIHNIQKDFIAAAVRAQKAGLDGIELHGAHGYLISQFLSPLINRRTDAYGGTVTKRVRFIKEIIAGIRKATGNDFIIGCRIGANEPDLAGALKIAAAIEKSRADLLHVSTGMETLLASESDLDFKVPRGFKYNWIVYGGTEIKKKVKVPIIVVNGIRTPAQANFLIEKGKADFVAIGKGLLVDPTWANQAEQNLPIVPCIDCKVCAHFRPGAKCPQTNLKRKLKEKKGN
ncbi:MAG TPA: NADH:flavin oxidoreductase [Dehalococcoidales bacterium]